MERFTISKFSVIANMISDDGIFPTTAASIALRDVRRECREKSVEVHFLPNEKVRIIGQFCRTIKVPKKCLESLSVLSEWIHERIEKAW